MGGCSAAETKGLAEDGAELGVEDGVDEGVEGAVDVAQPGDRADQPRRHSAGGTQRPGDVHHKEGGPAHQEGPWRAEGAVSQGPCGALGPWAPSPPEGPATFHSAHQPQGRHPPTTTGRTLMALRSRPVILARLLLLACSGGSAGMASGASGGATASRGRRASGFSTGSGGGGPGPLGRRGARPCSLARRAASQRRRPRKVAQ